MDTNPERNQNNKISNNKIKTMIVEALVVGSGSNGFLLLLLLQGLSLLRTRRHDQIPKEGFGIGSFTPKIFSRSGFVCLFVVCVELSFLLFVSTLREIKCHCNSRGKR